MEDNVLSEILEWSTERPSWQRDALRRLFTKGELIDADIDELMELCKAAYGLAERRELQPLSKEHIAIKGEAADPVTLVSVTHHAGVNALAPEQTIIFGTNLTIVYGANAAGKSGYTRILKSACRSRFTEEILGNVISREAPKKAQATIRYNVGAKANSIAWTPDSTATEDLSAVSVFDAYCAPVYLRDETDVAFRPFGLDVFDKLATVCSAVRDRLEIEKDRMNASLPTFPSLPEGTRVKTLIDSLTALTSVDEVKQLTTLSLEENKRLTELQSHRRDFEAADPKKRSKELELKASRIDVVVRHIAALALIYGDSALKDLQSAAVAARVAREALSLLAKKALTQDLLPGTGDEVWAAMWDATKRFSEMAYPGSAFPVLSDNARCPFCQQLIGPDAAARLRHLQEYITSVAQAEVRQAEIKYASILKSITDVDIEREDVTLATSELATDDAELAKQVGSYLDNAARLRKEIMIVSKGGGQMPGSGLTSSPEAELRASAKVLRERASQLLTQSPTMDPKIVMELKELESRHALSSHQQAILQEIDRRKRLAVYDQCLHDTLTQQITRKSTELTKRLITDQLRKTFQTELNAIGFTHLGVEIQPVGGARGALYHRLSFTDAPGVVVIDVLSEGESRSLSLAAFLAELSTARRKSAIIFDDPVSSLDHCWRERIAHRLTIEAKNRQVIVFTHDLIFLRQLLDESDREGIQCHHQYVRRDSEVGICSSDLPWIAMKVKDRMGILHNRWQAADKLFRDGDRDAYEREARSIYGLLREAWEQAVGEVLLYDVVERFRRSIETQRLRFLHDITEGDCKTVEDEMSKCSRWMTGHDQAAANGTPFPEPAELRKSIEALDTWAKTIRKRRA